MKTKKVSRVLALLLSVVMLLGSLPTAAFAEEKDVIVSEDEYGQKLDKVVVDLYNALMATESWEEINELLPMMPDKEIIYFLDRIIENELVSDDLDLAKYDEHVYNLLKDYIVRMTLPVVGESRKAADFLAPVEGRAISAYSLRSSNLMLLQDNSETSTSGLTLDKEVTWDPTTEKGKIRLEVFSTGATVTTITKTYNPVDIVLVLDLSNSMNDSLGEEYRVVEEPQKNTSITYHVKVGDEYLPVLWCTRCNNFTYNCQNRNSQNGHRAGTVYTPTNYAAEDGTSENVTDFYFFTTITKKLALEEAVDAFVASIVDKALGENKESSADDVAHRIGVVSFNARDNTKTFVNGAAISNGGVEIANTVGYAGGLVDVSTSAGKTSVEASVDAAIANGMSGTRIDLGIQEANKLFENNPIVDDPNTEEVEKRSRVVVVFTDGAPSDYKSWFDQGIGETGVARNAVEWAYETKNTHQATVYTIGILNGADGKVPVSADSVLVNRMLHYISSNFKNRTVYDDSNGVTYNTGATYPEDYPTTSYYLTTETSGGLNDIFDSIAENVNTAGGSNTKLTEESVVLDIVTPYFKVDGAIDKDIKVYVAQCTGETNGVKTFGPDVEVYPNDKRNTYTFSPALDYDYDENGENPKAVVLEPELTDYDEENGQTIQVDGFDFSNRWCGSQTAADNSVVYHGQKLILEIPFTKADGFLGGNEVGTNGDASGVHYKDDQGNEKVVKFDKKDANVVVEKLIPNIKDDHIYLSNAAELDRLIGVFTSDGDNGNNGEYQYYFVDDNGDPITDSDGNIIYYGINGVRNAYVDIVYTFYEGETEIGAFTIPAGSTSGQWDNVDNTRPILEDDKEYEVICTITPTVTKNAETGSTEGYFQKEETEESGWVYVYTPVLTFQDTAEKYNDLNSAGATTDDDYYAAKNYLSTETYWYNSNLKWKSTEAVVKVDEETTKSLMNGSVPGISLTYDDAEKALMDTAGKVISKVCIPVNVSHVYLDGDSDGDYIAYTSTKRTCDLDCTEVEDHHKNVGEEAPAVTNDPEFVVHVYDVFGHLAITKTVSGTPANGVATEFSFRVDLSAEGTFNYTKPDGTSDTISSGETITLSDGQTVTIFDLPPETTYTVIETVPAGYVARQNPVTGAIQAGDTVTAAFTNTYTTGNLTVSKQVVGTNPPANETFNFTVQITPAVSGSIGGLEFNNGTASFQLKNGESRTITDLPINAGYTVTETENTAYTTTVNGQSGYVAQGTIDADGETAAYVNTYKTGSLTIYKDFAADVTPESGETFLFKVKSGNNIIAEVVIKGQGSATIKDLPYGQYTVEEDTGWSWRYTPVGEKSQNVTVDSDRETVTFTNKVKTDKWLDANAYAENSWETGKVALEKEVNATVRPDTTN